MVSKITTDPVLSDVERFLQASKMTATAFGRRALKDPMLVHELRQGRECKRGTRERIIGFIHEYTSAVAAAARGALNQEDDAA